MWLKVMPMLTLTLCVGTFVLLTDGQLFRDDLPAEVRECVQQMLTEENRYVDPSNITTLESIQTLCLQQFMWKFGGIQWSNFNITEKDKRFINQLISSLVLRGRQKRQAGRQGHPRMNGRGPHRPHPGHPLSPGHPPNPGHPPGANSGTYPTSGFRIRKEYRRLTDAERSIFHETLRQMKTRGQYDTFANLHSGVNVNSAHNGPNFPGWHRVYLSLFEEAMRQISPSVSLPYWDSTLDFDMPNPVDSIIWSTAFLGNGNGLVTSGPFSNWMTNSLEVRRNGGGDSSLFSKEIIERLLTRCRNSEILTPTAQPDFDFEFYHGGPHVWVGGQMAFLNSAAHDPVFFMHHAFVDYIWEQFRTRQRNFCRINPENDYPVASNDLHAPERPMDGFPQYRNIDGYQNYWTQNWYRYENSPSCTSYQPSCGSPYLRCDVQRQRCVSIENSTPGPISGARFSFAEASPVARTAIQQARAQEAMIQAGPKFRAPSAEPRTQQAQMALAAATSGRKKRALNSSMQDKLWNEFPKGPQFRAPPAEGRTAEALGIPFVPSTINTDSRLFDPLIAEGRAFPESEPLPLMPIPETINGSNNNAFQPNMLNDYKINGKIDRTLWSFIPVGVEFTNTQKNNKANISQMGAWNNVCVDDILGNIQVRIEAKGISYYGTYRTSVMISKQQHVFSAILDVGIKSPNKYDTKIVLSAVHSCGTLCEAKCLVVDSKPPTYRPCVGVLTISQKDIIMYGNNSAEKPTRTWFGDFTKNFTAEKPPLFFSCSNAEPQIAI